jgi:hypothetical protein
MELPDLDVIFKDAESCAGARSVISEDNALSQLAPLLRLARLEAGFAVREAARWAGMTSTQVWRVERGADARLSSYLRLAAVYGCRVAVAVTFPAPMSGIWLKANLRRREEADARCSARWAKRRGLSLPGA